MRYAQYSRCQKHPCGQRALQLSNPQVAYGAADSAGCPIGCLGLTRSTQVENAWHPAHLLSTSAPTPWPPAHLLSTSPPPPPSHPAHLLFTSPLLPHTLPTCCQRLSLLPHTLPTCCQRLSLLPRALPACCQRLSLLPRTLPACCQRLSFLPRMLLTCYMAACVSPSSLAPCPPVVNSLIRCSSATLLLTSIPLPRPAAHLLSTSPPPPPSHPAHLLFNAAALPLPVTVQRC